MGRQLVETNSKEKGKEKKGDLWNYYSEWFLKGQTEVDLRDSRLSSACNVQDLKDLLLISRGIIHRAHSKLLWSPCLVGWSWFGCTQNINRVGRDRRNLLVRQCRYNWCSVCPTFVMSSSSSQSRGCFRERSIGHCLAESCASDCEQRRAGSEKQEMHWDFLRSMRAHISVTHIADLHVNMSSHKTEGFYWTCPCYPASWGEGRGRRCLCIFSAKTVIMACHYGVQNKGEPCSSAAAGELGMYCCLYSHCS